MLSRIYVIPKGKIGVINSYLLSHKLGKNKLHLIAKALTNPVIEEFSIDKFPSAIDLRARPAQSGFSYIVEIGYLPGVTDNVAHTTRETILDLLGGKASKLAVYTSKIFLVKKNNLASVKNFAVGLYNPLIERAYIADYREVKKKGLPCQEPKVVIKKSVPVIKVPLTDKIDKELVVIGQEGILDPAGTRRGPLALDLVAMKAIQEHFRKLKREPTDIELESLAQTWSEHCKHTIFANPIDDIPDGLYKTYIQGATNLIRKQKGEKPASTGQGGDGTYNTQGDPFWLKEVVNNFIDNAGKYTKEGSVTVGLSRESGKIKFYVKDTGMGITADDKKILFTEGGRGKDSVKVNVDSTGYGLYSVKLIVEAHKGRVWAESEGAGKGSTFFVELNAVQG